MKVRDETHALIMHYIVTDAAQKWVKLKQTIKTKDRSAFVVAFSKTKEEKNKIRIAQVLN